VASRKAKTVLVSGASTGIGRATVRHLAARGHRVFAGVRKDSDAESIRADAAGLTGGGSLEPVQLDVTVPADIAAVVERIEGEGLRLDALVNNAGIVVASPLEALPVGDLRRQFEVNFFSCAQMIQACLPSLREARGRIINMSSISGRIANPFMGAYSASKHALEAYSDALRMELAPWGIRVLLIEPGPIQTPIWEKSGMAAADLMKENNPADWEPYRDGIQRMTKFAQVAIKTAPPASRVARCVSHALEARWPRRRYPVGRLIRLQLYVGLLMPHMLRDWANGRALCLRRNSRL
jgi:NAD(P)-dependent dehydrogenase (short-subunit alcohol dehydrogenase family)